MQQNNTKERKLISVVIPFFNEAPILESFLLSVVEQLESTTMNYEIIAVDDGSTDATWKILSNFHHQKHQVQIKGIMLSRNFGKENALCAGLAICTGDAVITIDGDGEHPVSLIPKMVKKWINKESDIVSAVRVRRRDSSFVKAVGSKFFYALMSSLTKHDFSGITDYKLLDRKVVQAWKSLPESSFFYKGTIKWLGFYETFIPFDQAERIQGNTKWSVAALFRHAINAITSSTPIPLRFISTIGMLYFIFAVIVIIHTLYMYFYGFAITGFSTVIVILLLTGSILMFALGIIGEYLANVYVEAKSRPRYIVKSHLHLNEDLLQ